MSSLGIPANLQATCGGSGTMSLTWEETQPSCTFAASGATSVTKSSQHQYSTANGLGTVSWGVGGIGASITQGGLLTLDGTACGMITVTATDSVCGASQVQARVTNGGVWVLESTEMNNTMTCVTPCTGEGYTCTGGISVPCHYLWGPNGNPFPADKTCETIVGDTQTVHTGYCYTNPGDFGTACVGMCFNSRCSCTTGSFYWKQTDVYRWMCP